MRAKAALKASGERVKQVAVPFAEPMEPTRKATMSRRANPTPSQAVDSPAKVDRKVMCAAYERCLDEAIKKNWVGFSCRHCLGFEPLRLDTTEWLADSLACTALVYVAEYPSTLKQKPRGSIVVRLQRMRSDRDPLGSG